jgi:hypothetical protein
MRLGEFGDREVFQVPGVRDAPFSLAVEACADSLAGGKRPSQNDPFTDILIRMMDPEDLVLLHSRCPTPDTAEELQAWQTEFQKWYFSAGHYRGGEELPGWDDYRSEPYVNAYVDGRTRKPRSVVMTHATRSDLCQQFSDEGVVGNSAEMLALYEAAAKLAEHCRHVTNQLPIVLIQGDPDTAREIANALHALARGKEAPLRLVKTANLEPSGIQSALEDRMGRTVLLDNIDRMPADCRSSLLEALEDRARSHLDSDAGRETDIRDGLVIATSNQDLPADLHERLSQHMLHVPPLQWRMDDVPLLVKHFLADNDALYPRRLPIACKCCEMVSNGKLSVRELKASIQRLKVDAEEPVVSGAGYSVELTHIASPAEDLWDEVTIEVASRDSIRIKKASGPWETHHFAAIGFTDERRGDMPDTRWAVLIDLLDNEGVLNTNDLTEHVELKPAIVSIRKRLQKATGIKGDPIVYDRKDRVYRAEFIAQGKPFETARRISADSGGGPVASS